MSFENGFMKGAFWGGVAGAITALAFAPKSGREFREEIKNRSINYKTDAETTLANAQVRAEETLKEAERRIAKIREDAETAVEEIRTKAADKIEEGRNFMESEKENVKKAVDAGMKAYKEESTETK